MTSKTGGQLLYVNPEDYTVTSWDQPSADQGTGLGRVRKKNKEYSLCIRDEQSLREGAHP